MELNELTIGKPVTASDNNNIKISVTRITEGEAIIEYFEPSNGKRVLKLNTSVPDGKTNLDDADIDKSFWTILFDGKPFQSKESIKGNYKYEIDTGGRNIRISST
jgi:hypothetical protein